MAREIPEVVRAAAGLAATVLDEARRLPETLPGLPVRVIGLAMQTAMKLQQQYAGYVARGDELFTGLRGEDEPGLATFDDDEPAPTGYRESAFDRAGDSLLTDAVDEAQSTIEEFATEAPVIEEVLEELAIEALVEETPLSAGPEALRDDATPPAVTEDADAVENALLESDRAGQVAGSPAAGDSATADVLTPDGDVTSVDAAVTDEGVAAVLAPESPAPATAAPATAAPAEDRPAKKAAAKKTAAKKAPARKAAAEGAAPADTAAAGNGAAPDTAASRADTAPAGTDGDAPAAPTPAPSTAAPATAPVDGYDALTIAQLRGRLRGYQLSTVEELIAYEEATLARAPYLTMLRNRLEKLAEQAVESSPLAPRG